MTDSELNIIKAIDAGFLASHVVKYMNRTLWQVVSACKKARIELTENHGVLTDNLLLGHRNIKMPFYAIAAKYGMTTDEVITQYDAIGQVKKRKVPKLTLSWGGML